MFGSSRQSTSSTKRYGADRVDGKGQVHSKLGIKAVAFPETLRGETLIRAPIIVSRRGFGCGPPVSNSPLQERCQHGPADS